MDSTERTILLVDKDHDYLDWAAKHLDTQGVRILRCDNSEKADLVCDKTKVDLVIADMQLEPFDGIELMKKLKSRFPQLVIILTAGFPNTSQVIKASQAGANDILGKEALTFELRKAVENALESVEALHKSESVPDNRRAPDEQIKIVGVSKAFQDVFKIVGRVARTNTPVLISGESGTGKELVAASIHEYSDRRKNEMVAINCGAIPENLLESELFGHEKGAFTGAAQRRIGRFEQCDNSTLFLDEIGEMPQHVQVKLLRVLQEGTFSRVGGNETLKSDVRIVAATNKNLADEVSEANFREDLYYRLNVVELHLPPLRARNEDIPLLAEYFLQKVTKKNGMARMKLSGEAILFLQQHTWPGNVRELENTMARACALASTDTLLPNDIPIGSAIKRDLNEAQLIDSLIALQGTDQCALTSISRKMITHVLDSNGGDLQTTADILGTSIKKLKTFI